MKNDLMTIVNNIPVDQKAPANSLIKKYLLEEIRQIIKNKKTIEQATIDRKKEEILDAYKKGVGFDKKVKALKDAKDAVEKAEEQLVQAGLTESGYLITFQEDRRYGQTETTVYVDGQCKPLKTELVKKIKKVQELLKAVEGEMEPFSPYARLEARMMMASTVGEAMAIINAVAGEEVFKVNTNLLGLPEPKKTNK
jgi:hypothetical protein